MLTRGFHSVLVLTLLLCSTGASHGNEIERQVLSITSQEVGTPSYNADGRLVRMEMKRFDSSGNYLGERIHSYEYSSAGQSIYSEYASYDAEGLQVSRMETSWDLGVPGALRVGERTFYDGADQVLRSEREWWRKDARLPIMTIQTEYYDADETLLKTRYAVTERDKRGHMVVEDISVFDPVNVQLARTYGEWKYDGTRVRLVTRRHYDENDELERREEIVRGYDQRGRWVSTETTYMDESEVTGFSQEERELNSAGRLVHRVVTWSDASGVEERRMSQSTTYDEAGRMKARRVSWEYLK